MGSLTRDVVIIVYACFPLAAVSKFGDIIDLLMLDAVCTQEINGLFPSKKFSLYNITDI